MKKSLIIIVLVSFLFSSCGSRKGWSCKKRYAVIESEVLEVDKCFLRLKTGDTLRNIPKVYAFSEGDKFKFIVLERYDHNCELVQKDLIDLRV